MFGPWAETEFFINAGRGFHENDARGTTITVDPVDGVTAAEPVRPMVRASGAEIGMRTGFLPYTQLALTAWALDLDSELIYVGDAGATEASRATDRHGVELGVFVMPTDWLTLDADLAWSHGRFSESDPAGNYIPGAVENVASVGVAVQHPARLVRRRALPPFRRGAPHRRQQRALGLDDGGEPRSRAAHRRAFLRGARGLQPLRLERQRHHIFLREPALRARRQPVEDRHFHPVEPRTLRLTLETRF